MERVHATPCHSRSAKVLQLLRGVGFGCIFVFFFFFFSFSLFFLFLSSLEKYVSFVLVGGEPVLGGFSILTCLFVSFVCLLCCLSHLLRGSTSSLRTHLSSGWGYVVSSPLWSSLAILTWYYFFGYLFPFDLFSFTFPSLSSVSFSFNARGLLAWVCCVWRIEHDGMAWYSIVYPLYSIAMY